MKNINEIIESYDFYSVHNEEELLIETADVFYMLFANSSVDTYNKISNKIWVYDEVIPTILETCKEDIEGPYYLNNLVSCMKMCYGLNNNADVLMKLQPYIQKTLEEWNCVFVQSVADVIRILTPIDNMLLMLPEKWCSPKLYKSVGEFLKTFGCERVKVKNRVGYKNNGEFTNEQIIHVGTQLNGVSLSDKFDFYPTPEELVNRVQELAKIEEDDLVLEPSAGTGSLLKDISTANITCVELNEVLAEILKVKGYNVFNSAFEDFSSDIKFDKIIMNPPFGKRLDAKHIVLAFNNYLRDGGTLVAIHSQGINNATDKASKEFQELVKKYGILQENYNGNEFKNSGKGTNVATTITKLMKG